MDLPEIIADCIRKAVVEVFSTMLDMEIKPGDAAVAPPASESNDGVMSFIGLSGEWAGVGSIRCSPNLACFVCSRMLQTQPGAVDEEVLDAIAELTNMVIGSVKNELENHVGRLGLSIPTVVFGRNFKTKGGSNAEWIVERFPCEGEELIVKVCLAPAKSTAASALDVPRLDPLHVLSRS